MRSTRFIGLMTVLLFLGGSGATARAQAQDTNGADDSVRNDLKSIATMMETFNTDNSRYPTDEDVSYNGKRDLNFGDLHHQMAFGDRLQAIKLTEDRLSYCLKVNRAEGVNDTTKNWRWVTDHGTGTGSCPDRFVVSSYPLVK